SLHQVVMELPPSLEPEAKPNAFRVDSWVSLAWAPGGTSVRKIPALGSFRRVANPWKGLYPDLSKLATGTRAGISSHCRTTGKWTVVPSAICAGNKGPPETRTLKTSSSSSNGGPLNTARHSLLPDGSERTSASIWERI